MKFEYDIPDNSVAYLSEQAKQELGSLSKIYAIELLDEANRLEAAGRSGSGTPEVTRSNIKDASLIVRKLPVHQSQSAWLIALKVLSSITTFLTGILFNIDKLKDANNQWGLPIFVFVLAIAIISTTADIILGRSK